MSLSALYHAVLSIVISFLLLKSYLLPILVKGATQHCSHNKPLTNHKLIRIKIKNDKKTPDFTVRGFNANGILINFLLELFCHALCIDVVKGKSQSKEKAAGNCTPVCIKTHNLQSVLERGEKQQSYETAKHGSGTSGERHAAKNCGCNSVHSQ